MIKEILSSVNLTHILNFINPFLTKSHFQFIKTSINKFLLCRDNKAGLFINILVLNATITILFLFLVNLDFVLLVVLNILLLGLKKWLMIFLIFLLFTIPKELRAFFCYDRTLLSKLAKAVNEVMKYQFHNVHKKIARKSKIPKSSPNYFTNSDIVHYGLITVIHTFGRDLKWNPHIHALVSLGGFTKNFTFKKLDYFHIPSIVEQWKYLVLNIVQNDNYPNLKIKSLAKKAVSKLYKEDKRLFFNVGCGDVNSPKGIVKYLGRYLARTYCWI